MIGNRSKIRIRSEVKPQTKYIKYEALTETVVL